MDELDTTSVKKKKKAPTANPQDQLPKVGNMGSLSFCLYTYF